MQHSEMKMWKTFIRKRAHKTISAKSNFELLDHMDIIVNIIITIIDTIITIIIITFFDDQ